LDRQVDKLIPFVLSPRPARTVFHFIGDSNLRRFVNVAPGSESKLLTFRRAKNLGESLDRAV
jgi:hypothetical protein